MSWCTRCGDVGWCPHGGRPAPFQPRFSYEKECWLCPYCGSDANDGVCSGCDKNPTLRQIMGQDPLNGSRRTGRPSCKHPIRLRSKATGQCLECKRQTQRARRQAMRQKVA